MKKTVLLLWIAAAVLSSSGILCAQGSSESKQKTGKKAEQFHFGLEYAMLGGADRIIHYFSPIGARWAKINAAGVGPLSWGSIEPAPPKDGVHTYRWERVDKAVLRCQKAGFVNLTVVLGPSGSKWGAKPTSQKNLDGMVPHSPPKEGRLDDYGAYVNAFVERYDGDGIEDMPGLIEPVLHYEITSEAHHQGYWQSGTVEDYIRLMRTSYRAVKKANSKAKVILTGIWIGPPYFLPPFTDKELKKKCEKIISTHPMGDARRMIAKNTLGDLKNRQENRGRGFVKRILKEKEYFDLLEIHADYTGIEKGVKWLRGEMKKNGYIKPIWVGDTIATPLIPSTSKKGFFPSMRWATNIFEAPRYDDGDVIFKTLVTGKDTGGYNYREVLEWFYRKQSQILVKNLVIQMALGVRGTHIYTFADGIPNIHRWKKTTGPQKNWTIAGLIDCGGKLPVGNVDLKNFRPSRRQGSGFWTWKHGGHRPVYWTYKLIIDKLGSFSQAKKIQLGRKNLKAYRFKVEEKMIYVMWYDDGKYRKPGEKEAGKAVDLSSLFATKQIKITKIPVKKGEKNPHISHHLSKKVPLSETPIFVEEKK